MTSSATPAPHVDTFRLPLTFCLPAGASPMRLDAALGLALPDLGLRARRRLWEWCGVLVNNRPQAAGVLVYPGDTITLQPRTVPDQREIRDSLPSPPHARSLPAILGTEAGFTLISKPWGMHSAHIAGTTTASVEGLLPGLWQAYLLKRSATSPETAPPQAVSPPARVFAHAPGTATEDAPTALPRLLTRLDHDTSGLLVAANSPKAATCFRQWEAAGQIRKTYFALVAGACTQPLSLDAALNMANRATTTVLDAVEPDTTRHTCVTPVAHWPLAGTLACSLVRVDIRRGARHQIRAHLAHAGFPLVGDARYGAHDTLDTVLRLLAEAIALPSAFTAPLPSYLLHHAQVVAPAFTASLPPSWQGLEALCPNDNSPPASQHGAEGLA